jgi:hypothetical protein
MGQPDEGYAEPPPPDDRGQERRRPYDRPDEDYVPRDIRKREDEEEGPSMIPVKNMPALLGYYCGVFSMIPCLGLGLGPIAVVLGIMGLRAVSQNPRKKGTGHAIAALILGGITTLGNWGVFLLFVLAGASGAK